MNICGLNPDGYLEVPERIVPFTWMGNIDPCSSDYDNLKEAIKKNGDTAIGLFAEIAATPQKVELGAVWFENMRPVEGLHIKLELIDMNGDVIEVIEGADDIDLGIDPCGEDDSCKDGCKSGGTSTYFKFRFDRSGSKGNIGRGESAILRLTIIDEPADGLFGTDCYSAKLPLFTGGLSYRSFCTMRSIVSMDNEDFTCLDGATDDVLSAWSQSSRIDEV